MSRCAYNIRSWFLCGRCIIRSGDKGKRIAALYASRNNSNVAKFADTGIDELIRQMENLGASKSRLVAKMAGGAQMFAMASQNESLRVGERNAAAARAKLKEYRIRLLAEDCGLNYGRTVEFYSETGDYVIKSVGKPQKTI